MVNDKIKNSEYVTRIRQRTPALYLINNKYLHIPHILYSLINDPWKK
jgi:hypothetical protein